VRAITQPKVAVAVLSLLPAMTVLMSGSRRLVSKSCCATLGGWRYPSVSLDQMIDRSADWLSRDMMSLGQATHFEVRAGTS
jgi:hypothetical protein